MKDDIELGAGSTTERVVDSSDDGAQDGDGLVVAVQVVAEQDNTLGTIDDKQGAKSNSSPLRNQAQQIFGFPLSVSFCTPFFVLVFLYKDIPHLRLHLFAENLRSTNQSKLYWIYLPTLPFIMSLKGYILTNIPVWCGFSSLRFAFHSCS
jgi:hypothetical protein